MIQIQPPSKHLFQHIFDDNWPVFLALRTSVTRKNKEELIFVPLGKYFYIEASSWSLGDNAKLQLAVPWGKSHSCLTFYYHMYGSSMGTLNVFNGNHKIFSKSGDQGFYWRKVSRMLHLSDVVSMMGIHFYTTPY